MTLHKGTTLHKTGTLVAALAATFMLLWAAACGAAETTTVPAPASTATSDTATTVGSAPASKVGAPEVAKVDLIMDWVPWVLDIPIDVAQEKGFYADAGLEVTQTLPAGPTDVLKFVSTGKSQFGLYYAPDMLMGVAEGASLISVAALMGHAPVGLAVAPGVEVTEPKGLVGKVVAVPLIPSTRASYDSMLKAGGVDPKSVTLVDPGFNLVAPLLKGTYQAVAFTEFGELVEAEAAGAKPTYLDFRDWGTPDYAFLNVIAASDFAQKNPNTVRVFVETTMAGLSYAAEHPEEAVDIYVARHPELKKDLLLAQWRAALPSMAAAVGDKPAGWQDVQAWEALNGWMVQAGLLTQPVDLGASVSNDYLAAP